ncbi:MAG: hypothetical protein ACTSXA_13250 [Candidatus Heimdallarchaeota archaeon]
MSKKENNTTGKSYSITNYAYWYTIRDSIYEMIDEQLIQIAFERGLKPHRQKLIRENYGDFQNFMKQKIRYMLTELLTNNEVIKKLRLINQESKTEQDQISGLTKILVDAIMLSDENKQRILDYISEFITFLIVF